MLHTIKQGIEAWGSGRLKTLLILADELQGFIGLVETGLKHGEPGRIIGTLTEVSYAQVVLVDDATLIVTFDTSQHIEQSTLTCSVACNEPHALPLSYTKRDARKEDQVAK